MAEAALDEEEINVPSEEEILEILQLLKEKGWDVALEERKNDPVFMDKLHYMIGHATIETAICDPEFKMKMHSALDKYLTRPDDRALFDLPPLGSGNPR